jgi:glutathione synthase/RimK-type ligase-like ATP-grasp enzyme
MSGHHHGIFREPPPRRLELRNDVFDAGVVLKPLDLMGGAGIFLLRSDDANFNTILEQSTRGGRS